MRLAIRGHPLHTRALAVELRDGGAGTWVVDASVLDVRKRGFVPTAGELRPPGVLHHMFLDGVVDPTRGVLERVTVRQPTVAFEASAATGGETCRDLNARVEALAGTAIDDAWAQRVSAEIGGPRGCSHVLNLAQLVGSTIRSAVARERALHGPGTPRPAGQRLFRRDILADGHEPTEGRVELGLQLLDLHEAPARPGMRPMDRLAGVRDVRALAEIDCATYTLARLEAAERWRTLDSLDAPWLDRTGAVSGLAGTFLFRGVTRAVLAHLGERAEDQPLRDLILQLAPAMIQVGGALSERWLVLAREQGWFVGMSGLPDSCYMWRAGGGLARARAPGDPVTVPR